MGEFDPGPPQPFHDLFDNVPDYGPFRRHFSFDWGAVFYRRRLDGSASVLCVASDPGATERVAARTLAGVKAWPGKGAGPVLDPHPSSRAPTVLLDEWRAAVPLLRGIVTPDPGGEASGPSYGTTFGPADYAPIPRRDLPTGVPDWLGDDTCGRTGNPATATASRVPSRTTITH